MKITPVPVTKETYLLNTIAIKAPIQFFTETENKLYILYNWKQIILYFTYVHGGISDIMFNLLGTIGKNHYNI